LENASSILQRIFNVPTSFFGWKQTEKIGVEFRKTLSGTGDFVTILMVSDSNALALKRISPHSNFNIANDGSQQIGKFSKRNWIKGTFLAL
jgi:hypothetical protein